MHESHYVTSPPWPLEWQWVAVGAWDGSGMPKCPRTACGVAVGCHVTRWLDDAMMLLAWEVSGVALNLICTARAASAASIGFAGIK